jgi:DNA-directed RNA polymerase subunit M/transcription elongation factor TFIIS
MSVSESTSVKREHVHTKGMSILRTFISDASERERVQAHIISTTSSNEAYINAVYNLYGLRDRYASVLPQVGNLYTSSVYEPFRKEQQDKDDFVTNPFSVEEGVMQCTKCGSKKTYSTQRQVRSADEGFTTFCYCMNCSAKWRIN